MNEIRKCGLKNIFIISSPDKPSIILNLSEEKDIKNYIQREEAVLTEFIDNFEVIVGVIKIKNFKAVLYVKESLFIGRSHSLKNNLQYPADVYRINKIRYVVYFPVNIEKETRNEVEHEIKRVSSFIETNSFYYTLSDSLDNQFKWNKRLLERFKNVIDDEISIDSFLGMNNGKKDIFLEPSEDSDDDPWNIKGFSSSDSSSSKFEEFIARDCDASTNKLDLSTDNEKISYENENKNFLTKSKTNEISNYTGYVFCGFFKIKQTEDKIYKIEILSLISTSKIGPRFLCRGVDDHGNSSFFVETNFKLINAINEKILFEKTLLRGSIPLFWYQDKNPLRKQLKFSRENEVSYDAFKNHFDKIKRSYPGKTIIVLTLLSKSKEHEKELTDNYIHFLEKLDIIFIDFDLNRYTKDYKKLKLLLFMEIETVVNRIGDGNVVFRVSCLDCLDRTNIAQHLILEYFITRLMGTESQENIFNLLSELCVENGHVLSNFYSGSDSLKSELPKNEKRSLIGVFDDLLINANRVISGKFNDNTKQEIINTILQKNKEHSSIGTVLDQTSNIEKIPDHYNISEASFINKNLETDNDLGLEIEFNDCKKKIEVMIFNWCINGRKFGDGHDFDIKIHENICFVVITIQKISTSFKKLLFDEKQTERNKWKRFFEKKVQKSCPDMILFSQNFTYDIGIMLFIRKNISKNIINFYTKKIKRSLINPNISILIRFTFLKKILIFTTGKYYINEVEVVKREKSLLGKHLEQSILEIPSNKNVYKFLTGYFNSNLDLSNENIRLYSENMDYDKIFIMDYLYNNMGIILPNFREAEIVFPPTGDYTPNSNYIGYNTRIIYDGSIQCHEYKDILYYETGHKPVIGRYYLDW